MTRFCSGFFMFILLFLCINGCPCVCRTQAPKLVNLCLGQAARCRVIRCNPRSLGFACCERGTRPTRPATKSDAVKALNVILDNGQEAVRTEPALSRRLARIMLVCRSDATVLVNARPARDPNNVDSGLRAYRRVATAVEDTFLWIFNNLDKHF